MQLRHFLATCVTLGFQVMTLIKWVRELQRQTYPRTGRHLRKEGERDERQTSPSRGIRLIPRESAHKLHLLALCTWRSHKRPRETWGRDSENSFSLNRAGALEKCQEPGRDGGYEFPFHFAKVTELHWRPPRRKEITRNHKLQVPGFQLRPSNSFSVINRWTWRRRTNIHLKTQNQNSRDDENSVRGLSGKEHPFHSESLLIEPAKTNWQ